MSETGGGAVSPLLVPSSASLSSEDPSGEPYFVSCVRPEAPHTLYDLVLGIEPHDCDDVFLFFYARPTLDGGHGGRVMSLAWRSYHFLLVASAEETPSPCWVNLHFPSADFFPFSFGALAVRHGGQTR